MKILLKYSGETYFKVPLLKKNYTLHKKYDNSKSELLDWPSVGKEIEARLGKDIYESWISKLK